MPVKSKTAKIVDALDKTMRDHELKEPRVANVAAHFIEMVGGERAFASLLYREFCSPHTTVMMKTKIMQLIMQAVRFSNEKAPPSLGATGELTDVELNQALAETLGEMKRAEEDASHAERLRAEKAEAAQGTPADQPV